MDTTEHKLAAAARAIEHQSETLFESAGDAIYVLEAATGRIIKCNVRACLDLGYSRDELLKLSAADIEAGLTPEEIVAIHQQVQTGTIKTIEGAHKRKGGTIFPVEIRLSSLAPFQPELLLSIVRDITERKKAEEAVVAAAREWQNTFDAIPSSVFILDTEDRIMQCNKATELLLGKTQVEIIGRHCWGLMHGTDRPIPECPIPAMKKDHERKSMVISANDRWLQITVEPVLDETGEVAGAVHTIDDITKEKKSEKQLRESEEKYRALVEATDTGYLILDRLGKVIDANKEYVRLTGYDTFEDILGRYVTEWTATYDLERNAAEVNKCFEQGYVRNLVVDYVNQMGHTTPVEINATVLGSGDSARIISLCRDITEHRKLEEQLRHAQKMEAVGTLAGGIAHDFNNILNVIIGYGTMVMDKLEAGSPSKEQMKEVLTAADRAANLTRQLLVFSRKQAVEVKLVNINELISGLQKMLGRIVRENIEIQLELSDRPLIVLGDAGQIEQVLMNLASNAKDAMPNGGFLTIKTRRVNSSESGIPSERDFDSKLETKNSELDRGFAEISVTDTGSGMDEATQKKIFEPFFTTKGTGEGAGLGLAISYGIIKQHNGYIKVYSELGKGTEFKIFLPLIEDPAALAIKAEPSASASAAASGGNETILVAEDDASLRKLSSIVLESYGYTVITAEDGEDAIAKFMENREKISLAVIDMVMPKKNGKEVAEAIRTVSPGLKMLFVSGYTMDIIMTNELTESGFDFILKPILPRDLLRKVREVLDR